MHGPLPEVTQGSQPPSIQNLYRLWTAASKSNIKPKHVNMILFLNKNLE